MRLLTLFALIASSLWATSVSAKTFLIYSVTQDLPMGVEGQILKKNFYVNMGAGQGVKKGTVLDVFRVTSMPNPYDQRKRVNHKIKIGELKVINASDEGSIAVLKGLEEEDVPVLEVNHFMVGDQVSVNVD